MKKCISLVNISIDDNDDILYYINPRTFFIVPEGDKFDEFADLVKRLSFYLLTETSSGIVDLNKLLGDD